MRTGIALLFVACVAGGCTTQPQGATIRGKVSEVTANTISLRTEDGVITFDTRRCNGHTLMSCDSATVKYLPPIDNGFARALEVR